MILGHNYTNYVVCDHRQQLKPIMDSISWAFRHTERNIAETGLNLLEMLKKFQVTQFVNGRFESTNDLSIFTNHIRDFPVQSKEFSAQDNKDLYADEAAARRERERQRMLSIPWLIAHSPQMSRKTTWWTHRLRIIWHLHWTEVDK